jgi:phosphate transport system substrate-binding protein
MSGTSNPPPSTSTTTMTSTTSSESLSGGPRRSRASTVGMGVAIAIAVVLLVVGLAGGYYIGKSATTTTGTAAPGTVSLTETGSSLLYPLFHNYLFPNYTKLPNGGSVVLSAASTGSGTGQASAEQGLVNIGASDAYLANASQTSLVNIPIAISAQLIYYNLHGVTGHLNLNGTVLAMIYNGTITSWDDPMILAAQTPTIQSELKGLSSQTITVIKRADSSGDTFLFTSYCYMSWSGFGYPVSTSGLSGLSGANVMSATGNSGMVSLASTTPNSIAYIGISYESSANAAGLQYAALGDNASLSASGGVNPANYVLPSATNISEDANLALVRLNVASYGLSISLILGGSYLGAITLSHGGGGTNPTSVYSTPYPDANLEYTLIKTAPTGTTVTATNLAATVSFLEWAITTGNYQSSGAASVWLDGVNFVPLTPEVIGYDETALAGVST